MESILEIEAHKLNTRIENDLNAGNTIHYDTFALSMCMPTALQNKIHKKKPTQLLSHLTVIQSPTPEDYDQATKLIHLFSSSQKKSFELISSLSKRRFDELDQEERFYSNYLAQNELIIGESKALEQLTPPKKRCYNNKITAETSSTNTKSTVTDENSFNVNAAEENYNIALNHLRHKKLSCEDDNKNLENEDSVSGTEEYSHQEDNSLSLIHI